MDRTRRRLLRRLAGLGAATAGLVLTGCGSFRSAASAEKRVPRIGFLWLNSPGPGSAIFHGIDRGLAENGYVDGENIIVEHRSAEQGRMERMPEVAAELVALGVRVIIVGSGPTLQAALDATQSVPIVIAGAIPIDERISHPFIASLARPGGNVTGPAGLNITNNILSKHLDLFKESAPNVSRVWFLLDNSMDSGPVARPESRLAEFTAAAQGLGLDVGVLHAPTIDDLEGAFGAIDWQATDGLFAPASSAFYVPRARIIAQAARYRVPAIYQRREYAQDGGLMAYGTYQPDYFQRAMYYVHRILTGTRPGDLPIEVASRIHFVLNLKTAAALGFTFPLATLRQATELIR